MNSNSSSDNRIQHCFNLVGLEYAPKEKPQQPFLYRQAAAYHSFTPSSGKSVWIILKANTVIRDSMVELIKGLGEERHPGSPKAAFRVGMRSHQIMYEWAIETWTPYIDHIEKEISELADISQFIPVAEFAADPFIAEQIKRRITANSHLSSWKSKKHEQQSWFSKKAAIQQLNSVNPWSHPHPGSHQTAGVTQGLAIALQNLPYSGHHQNSKESLGTDTGGIPKIFRFDRLQKLYVLAKTLQQADLVLSQNQAVIRDMIERYREVTGLDEFKKHVDIDRHELQMFLNRAERCVHQLQNHQVRVSSLKAGLDKTIDLVIVVCNVRHRDKKLTRSSSSMASCSSTT
jgi:hypothetical protein